MRKSITGKYKPLGKTPATLEYKNYLHQHIKDALYVPKTIAEEDELESATLSQEPLSSVSLPKETIFLNNDDTHNITATSSNIEEYNNHQQSLLPKALVNTYLNQAPTEHDVEQPKDNLRLSFSEDSYVTLPSSLSHSINLSNDDLYLKPASIDTTHEAYSSLEHIYDVPMHHDEDTYLNPMTINDNDEPYYPIFVPSRNSVIDNNQHNIYEEVEEVVYEEILDIQKPKSSFFQKIQSAVNYVGDHIAQASHNIAAKLNIIKSNFEPLIENAIDKVAHFWHELNLHDNVAVHYYANNNENEEPTIEFTTIKHPLVVHYFAGNDDMNAIQITGSPTSDDCESTYL